MTYTRANDSQKVIVGLTGNASSSVAAFLLKKQGFSVIGVAIQTNNTSDFPSRELAPSCHLENTDQIKKFCESIKIPFHIVESKAQFKDNVIDPLLSRRISGLANNSCYDCSRFKLNVLYKKMLELKADFISTGHFAKVQKNLSSGIYSIYSNSDQACDQSHLLSDIDQSLLKHLLLPLGEISISDVLKISNKFNLTKSKDSKTETFCFDNNDFFIEKNRDNIPRSLLRVGETLNVETKESYGKHKGFSHYKVGQTDLKFDHYTSPSGSPKYEVIGFSEDEHKLLIGDKSNITSKGVLLSNLSFEDNFVKTKPFMCLVKSKSFLTPKKCIATFKNNHHLFLEFDEEVYPLILGESVVVYDNSAKSSRVLGSGRLSARGELKLIDRAVEYRGNQDSDELAPTYLKF